MVDYVEQDTTDSEDIPNLLQFLLPDGTLPPNPSLFSLSFNKRLLNGWVKQPSACCGAASIAGAWNGLLSVHRSSSLSFNHNDVLDVYREMFDDLIYKKQSAFERKLGASINEFLVTVNKELQITGREIGGKKGFGATKKLVMDIIKRLARIHYQETVKMGEEQKTAEKEGESGFGGVHSKLSAMDCFVDLLKLDGFSFGVGGSDDKEDGGKESDNEVSKSIPSIPMFPSGSFKALRFICIAF
jgi:hypothetical protein